MKNKKQIEQLAKDYENFKNLWDEVKEKHLLPDTAVYNLPELLSRETKGRMCQLDLKEVIRIIEEAIDEINNGSIKSMDQLVREKL